VFVTDVEVAYPAEVAEGDAAVGIEAVAANAVIDRRLGQRGGGFEPSVESLQRGAAIESAMPSVLVVDDAKGLELELEVSERLSGSLLGQKELEGLVEAFDFAAGLGVIRRGVNALHAEARRRGAAGWE